VSGNRKLQTGTMNRSRKKEILFFHTTAEDFLILIQWWFHAKENVGMDTRGTRGQICAQNRIDFEFRSGCSEPSQI